MVRNVNTENLILNDPWVLKLLYKKRLKWLIRWNFARSQTQNSASFDIWQLMSSMDFKEPERINTFFSIIIKAKSIFRQLPFNFSNPIMDSDILNGYFFIELWQTLIILLRWISARVGQKPSRQTISCLNPEPRGSSIEDHFHFLELIFICAVLKIATNEYCPDVLLIEKVREFHVMNRLSVQLQSRFEIILSY